MNAKELVRLYREGVRDFSGVDLSRVDIRGVYLKDTKLCGANLHGVLLNYANLRNIDLCGSNLSYSNLCGVHFCGANLNGADLKGVYFEYADFSGADLKGVCLEGVSLIGVKGNGVEIIDGPVNSFYSITMTKHAIQIGCKNYSYEEWLNFIDEDIKDMDYDALGFWSEYKDAVLGLWVENFGADQ